MQTIVRTKPFYVEYKNSQNSALKNNSFRKWTKDMKRHFTKGDIHMSNNHIKRYSASKAIKEMQIKTTPSYHYTPNKTAKIENSNHTKC